MGSFCEASHRGTRWRAFRGVLPPTTRCSASAASAPVDPPPAVTPFAPARSTAEAAPNLVERHIGQLVANAASAVALALREYQNGGLTSGTKMAGGDCIAQLYTVRQFLIADFPDFDAIARKHGTLVLRETCGTDVDARTIDVLVDEVLAILSKVVRAAAN